MNFILLVACILIAIFFILNPFMNEIFFSNYNYKSKIFLFFVVVLFTLAIFAPLFGLIENKAFINLVSLASYISALSVAIRKYELKWPLYLHIKKYSHFIAIVLFAIALLYLFTGDDFYGYKFLSEMDSMSYSFAVFGLIFLTDLVDKIEKDKP
jgi:O-antigen/teichoic acid export membrane protein